MRLPVLALALIAFSCAAQTPGSPAGRHTGAESRPPIIGVSHIAVYTSDAAKTEHFYVGQMGLKKGADPENASGVRYYVNQEQFIEVLPLPSGAGVNRLDHIGYMTKNADALRRYLGAHGVTVPDAVRHASDGSLWFEVQDPEGNRVRFVQPPARLLAESPASLLTLTGADPIGRRIIHVGMLVHSEEKENTFYRDLLGFRPYWHGGMQPDRTDWVSQQVPDGHDWIEYMLYHGPGDASQISQQQLGVLDHFSIGVVNMEKTVATLYNGDRLGDTPPRPQIGRDSKWQFNMYDPDMVRAELMEFSAVGKPCCSGFTAPNPAPEGQP